MHVWHFLYEKLKAQTAVLLLWVLESEGSSPGRRGFKMAVASDGDFYGTIGGGIMEHKLVEKAKKLLTTGSNIISLLRQHHAKEVARDQSGMICSGSQLIAFVPLFPETKHIIKQIADSFKHHKTDFIQLNPTGISIHQDNAAMPGLKYKTANDWIYNEPVNQSPVIHIIGGGHVGLALSELLLLLGFYIKIYDNRPGINTLNTNAFAHEKYHVDYAKIGEVIASNDKEYVVIMTFGYRDDKIVFKQLLHKQFFYLGMMGSENKTKTLLKELTEEGCDAENLKKFFIPIGINIHSQTAMEIAVSITAEIIREKNKLLPSGRS